MLFLRLPGSAQEQRSVRHSAAGNNEHKSFTIGALMEVVLLKTLSALTRKSPKLMTFMALAWTFESIRR
jgi:hypothetical protein